MSKGAMLKQIETMRGAMKEKPYHVTGFVFVLDDGENEIDFNIDSREHIAFHRRYNPQGFVYVADEDLTLFLS